MRYEIASWFQGCVDGRISFIVKMLARVLCE